MSSSTPKVEIATYYMSIHFGVCHGPVDSLRSVYVGEKLAWSGDVTDNTSINIDLPNLFGGVKKEGGLKGVMEVFLGGAGQLVSQALATRLGRGTPENTPGYRGMTSVLFRGQNAGGFYWSAGTPYLKPTWFTVRRVPRGLNAGNAVIPLPSGEQDANPAHVIYECLTNTDWGMGADSSAIDVSAFLQVAATLYSEQFGISMLWNNSGSIEGFVNEILGHINGSLFTNPRTGKITIRLLRDDYNAETLRVLNPDNAQVDSFSRKAWGETTNEMKVTWTNPANEQEETVYSQDLGNIAVQGQVISDSRNYFGVRSSALAQKLCDRELRSASAPLCSMEVTVDRSFWDITPLECIKVQWPEYGLEGQVMRVMKVSYGRTGASSIKLSLVEDIFSLPRVTFVAPPGTSWVNPAVPQQPIATARIFPLPAYMVVDAGGALSDFEYPEAGVAVIAKNPVTSGSATFDVLLQEPTPSGGSTWVTEMWQRPFVGSGQLSTPLVQQATSAVGDLTNADASLEPNSFLLIGSDATPMNQMEIALVTAYDALTNVATVKRGVLDTIPRAWAIGTKVWVIRLDDITPIPTVFTDLQSLSVKLLTNTILNQTPEGTAPVFTETVLARAVLPLRPANVQINGEHWPDLVEAIGASLTVTWSRRNRLLEDSVVLGWTEADVTPEAGTTYTVRLYRVDTNALVGETTGAAGTSASIASSYGGMVRLRVTAVRDGLESYQPFEHVFELVTSELRLTEEDGDERVTEGGEARILES